MTPIETWYQFLLAQLASESYLDLANLNDPDSVKSIIANGNSKPGFPPNGFTRMSDKQADEFLSTWDVVTHYANDRSGFSATLLTHRFTGRYTLSFRSTEFQRQANGGDWERDGVSGAGGEIAGIGFALGQIESMETFYEHLRRGETLNRATGHWEGDAQLIDFIAAPGRQIDVTGYSLGGHLATVFTELHAPEVLQTYTFNGPGRGDPGRAVGVDRLVDYFRRVLNEPRLSPPLASDFESQRLFDWAINTEGSLRNPIYNDPRYQYAVLATRQEFSPRGLFPDFREQRTDGPFSKITQIYGRATHDDTEVVANSGVHGKEQKVFIEDQPDFTGLGGFEFGGLAKKTPGDFGTTHNITLIGDSLALMRLFSKFGSNLDQTTIEKIFAASSNERGSGSIIESASRAEGESLERALDALRDLFLGTGQPATPDDKSAGGFANNASREAYYENIAALDEATTALQGRLTITSLVGKSHGEIAEAAKGAAGLAWRYALATGAPFIVLGDDGIFQKHNQNGELDLYDPQTGRGTLTSQYIEDRAQYLAYRVLRNEDNVAGTSAQPLDVEGLSGTMEFQDRASGERLFVRGEVFIPQRRVYFGAEGKGSLSGASNEDRLYGASSEDSLIGKDGEDYLEGGAGGDQLSGGGGDDELLGGKDDDVLRGGGGTDTYFWRPGDGADTIIDFAGDGFGGDAKGIIKFIDQGTPEGRSLAGEKTLRDPAFDDKVYEDLEFTYTFTGKPGSSGKLSILKKDGSDATGRIEVENFKNGDLGISLVGLPTIAKTDQSGTNDNDDVSISDAFKRFFGLGGNDRVVVSGMQAEGWGGVGDDFISQEDGDQTLRGEEGRDILLASGGADTLLGGTENDALQGGDGDDLLEGEEGNDALDGGLGSDVLNGGAGDDFLAGGGTLVVGVPWYADAVPEFGAYVAAGEATGVIGMAGFVALDADAGDVLDGGAGNDTIFAGSGDDLAQGSDGDDLVSGDRGGDTLTGGDGADTLFGDGTQGSITIGGEYFYTLPEFHGNDVLLGGLGPDTLQGDGGADELYGGDDNDVLVGDAGTLEEPFHGADYLDGGEGNDLLLGYGKDDTLFGGPGDDSLGGDSSSIANALHGNDYLDGEDGADTLHGDGGADTLFGGAGDDTLDGDASNVAFEFHGDDYLEGEEGDDALKGAGGADRLFGGAGKDSLSGDGTGIPVEFVGDDYLDGGAGDDVLEAGAGDDTLLGGAGVDILRGEAGDDLYLVELGGQNDFIQDQEGTNTVRLGAAVSFVFQTLGSDGKAYLGLRYSGSDIVHIEEGLTNSSMRYELADGTVKTATDWRASFNQPIFNGGGSGADTLSGSALAELFVPGGGNDTILFDRGSGFDRVSGFGQIAAGTQGLDTIQLGAGIAPGDLLVKNTGHLTLTIKDTGDTLQLDNWFGSIDRAHTGAQVRFADGTTLNAAELISLALTPTDGNDVLTGGNGAETISGGPGDDNLDGDLASGTMIAGSDDVLFGGEGNDRLNGGQGSDTLDGGAGDDVLNGGPGADLYLYGAGEGSDVITRDDGADANIVQLKPGITPDDVTLTQGSIVVTLNATGETLTISDWYREEPTGPKFSVQELRFAEGTIWDAALINENANHASAFADLLRGIDTADTLYGLSGNDTLEGFSGDDVLVGGGGNDLVDGGGGADDLDGGAGNDILRGGANGDVLDGGAGDDTLDGGAGENVFFASEGHDTVIASADDVLVFGERVDADDVVVSRNGSGLRLEFASGSVRLTGDLIREVRFANGMVWGQAELNARITQVGVSILRGDGNDAITGGGGDDTLDGGAGDDLVQGGLGADLLRGGDGNDRLYGHDQFFSPLGDAAANQLFGDAGADQLFGSTGSEILDGGAGDDSLSGGAGNDTLDGGAGNDSLSGGAGSDIYRFGRASGHDTVSDTVEIPGPDGLAVPTSDLNVIQVDAAIGPDELVVSRSGAVLVIATSDGAASIRTSFFAAELGPAGLVVRFDDGTEWDSAALVTLAGPVAPTSDRDDLFGTASDDSLAGFDGNDSLDANAGDDHLEGGAGDDTLSGGQGDDRLDGGAGNDLLAGGFGSDTYLFGFGSGSDTIQEPGDITPPSYTQALLGEGDRILFAPGVGPEDVTFQFDGTGDETIGLLGSNDRLTIRAAENTLSRVEFAEFADGTVWHLGRLGPQNFAAPGGSGRHFGTTLNDFPALGADDEIFFGLGGNDSLTDLLGHNTLRGNEANDSFSTGTGDDVLSGGAGNDSYSPRTGDNRIHFGRGAGQDTLTLARHTGALGSDTVVFGEGVRPEHLRLRRGPDGTLIAEIAGTPDSLTIRDDPLANQGRAGLLFQFADATLWDAAQIESHIGAVALIEGGTGNNSLVGGDGTEIFVGGPGNDTLTGGGGRDTFVFSPGDGSDTIIDEAPRIVFGEGILPQQVTLSPSSFQAGQRDLFITIGGGGGQIIARNWFPPAHMGTIEFADGTVWDATFVGRRVPFTYVSGAIGTYTGTPGSDSFIMSSTADTMRGESGDDVLTSDGGNDQLFGGPGDDTLSAGTGKDNLQGEAGNDILLGGAGDDVLSGAAGNDLLDGGIDTPDPGEPDDDSLSGGEGDDVLRGRSGNDTLDGGSGSDTLSGGTGNDLLEAGAGDDLLDGGEGDDRLYGGAGSDVYLFGIGSGSDTLLDFDATGSAIDTVRMGAGVAPEDVEVMARGADLILRLAPGGDSLSMRSAGREGYGVERVVFEDGTMWDSVHLASLASLAAARERADLILGSAEADVLQGAGGGDIIDGGAGADALDGGTGDDVLLGGGGDDTLDGGAGLDHLTGGAGTDVFLITAGSGSDAIADLGSGDTLTFGPGISAADTRITRDRDHLYLEVATTGQFVTLESWFSNGAQGTVAFSNGVQWDGVYLKAAVDALTGEDDFFVGTDDAESVMSLAGLDTVFAGGGDDSVLGGEGSDTLHGEAGDDTLAGETGFDLLVGGEGNDTLEGGLDDDALFGDQGSDSLVGGDGFDELSGGTGNDTLAGGEGDDALTGGEGVDLLAGGAGNDTLNGGAGNDVYEYSIGSGSDTITESESTVSAADTLRLAGISPAEVEFKRFPTYTVLEIPRSADTLTFRELNFPQFLAVERVEFDDGTLWDQTEIDFHTIKVGTEGNDILFGFKGLVGLGGNDILTGGLGDNILDGGDGTDTLNGSAGNDQLSGGAGNDTLNGGAGDDSYVFGGGSGDDTVSNFDAGTGRRDVLAFTPDVAPQNVIVERVGNHLRVVLNGGADRLRIDNWFSGSDFQLSQARFADGTVWSSAALEALIALAPPTDGGDLLTGLTGDDSIDGLGGNDRIEGGAGNDALLGNSGNDTLFGGAGTDTLDGGAGNDALDGGAGNDTYVFGPGSGSDTVSDVDSAPGNVDVVRLEAPPGEVTVTQQFSNLVLTLASGERLTLQNWLSSDAQKVEEVRFSDGTVWDVAMLTARSMVPILGTENADFLSGTNGADTIDGMDGNDSIFAGLGSDTLIGAVGNDTLVGESGNDTLDGGSGNDVLNGGVGNDIYRFAAGYGFDTINEFDTTAGNVDVIEVDGLPSEAIVRRAGVNLELQLVSGDALVTAGWFTGIAQKVELVRFADGTTWDVSVLDTLAHADLPHTGTALADTLFGTNGADTLEGLDGNDRLEGRGGDDVLVGGPGFDSLNGGAGDDVYRFAAGDGFDTIAEEGGSDVLAFGSGISPAEVSVQRSGSHVFLTLFGGTEQVVLANWATPSISAFRIEEVRFADGTVWNERFLFDAVRASDAEDFILAGANGERIDALQGNDVVHGGAGDDELLGNAGDDTLSGEAGADTLDGGAGRDLLQGGPGDDRFVFSAGYGSDWITDYGGLDEVVFGSGLTTSNVIFTRDLSDLFVTAAADRLTLVDWFMHPDARVERFRFEDAIILEEDDVRSRIRAASPTSFNDTIFGSDSGEAISGLSGEDALYGEGGDDILDGGVGSDYLIGGSGHDVYVVDIRLDRVTEDPNEGTDTVIASASYALSANVENLTLSGTVAINGTGNAGDNIIIGNAGANVLDGGAGNDTLRGGLGNDAYVVRRNEGTDEVIDLDSIAGNRDEVRFAAGIAPNDVRVARSNDGIRLRIAGGGDILLRNWFDPAYRIESVRFADGTMWDAATIEYRSTLPDNQPPQVTEPIADQSAREDSFFDFTVPATAISDPDVGDALSYAASLVDGSPLPGWISFDPASAAFSGMPGNSDVGAFEVKVTASDTSGEAAFDVFGIEVLNTNDAPLAADDAGVAQEDGGLVTLAGATLLLNDNDIDAGDSLSIVGVANSAAGATVSLVNGDVVYEIGGLFQSLAQGAAATDTLAYTVADADGATSSATVTITISGANDAPELLAPLADQGGREGETVSFVLPVDAFRDVDANDAIAYSVARSDSSALPAWLSFDAASGTFSGNPSFADSGRYEIRLTASDPAGASASDTFALTIDEVCNDGEVYAGTNHDDVIAGGPCDDVILGFQGKDLLFGGAGNDLLCGGNSPDELDGGSGTNLFIGGNGGDTIITRGTNDVIAWNRGDGPDKATVGAAAPDNRLTLSFGSGVRDRDVGFRRRGEALVVSASGDAVTLENWFALGAGERPSLTVQIIGAEVRRFELSGRVNALENGELAGDGWRDEGVIATDPVTGAPQPLGGDAAYDYAMNGSSESSVTRRLAAPESAELGASDAGASSSSQHHGDDDGANDHQADGGERNQDDDEPQRDQIAEWIAKRLARAPRFDFEAFLDGQKRVGRPDDAHDIARRWQTIARYAHALADETDEHRLGALFGWQRFAQIGLFSAGGAGFGYEGSVGAAARGAENLKSLQGLNEGFRHL